MRLLVLEPHPSFGGGCEAVVLGLAQELAKRGHDLFLLYEETGSMLPVYETFTVERVRTSLPGLSRRRPGKALGCIARVGRVSRTRGIDVIVSSHLGFIPVAACVSAIFGTPWCFHLGLPSTGSTSYARFAYRGIAAGVSPSQHTGETWRRNGWPAQRLHVVPNWVDTNRFRPAADRNRMRRELGLSLTASYVIFIGRICEEKGVTVLLDAFRRMAADLRDANLLLVGRVESAYQAALECSLATLNEDIRRRVAFRPVTDSPEKYLAASDLACFPPTWDEPFGLALLEAMSCALPVIASRVGAVTQILGTEHPDLLVAPGDSAGLAAKLRWWLDRPKAGEECGHRLRKRIVQRFTAKMSVDRYEAVLSAIVDLGSGKAA